METTDQDSLASPDAASIRHTIWVRWVRAFCLALLAVVSIAAVTQGCEIGETAPRSPIGDQAVADLSGSSRNDMVSIFEAFEQSMPVDGASMQSVVERCEEGADDWKRTDPYLQRCSLSITRYYGYNGEFDRTTHTLHSQLRAAVVEVRGAGAGGVETQTEVIENVSEASDPSFGQLGPAWAGIHEYYRAEDLVADHVVVNELGGRNDHLVAVNLSEIYYELRR